MSYAAAIRKPIDPTAVTTMALLCFIWGFGHVAAKLAAPGMSLVMQGGIRCAIALVLLVGWARLRAIPLFDRDGTLGPGIAAGALFAAEFLFIFTGLNYTGASRMVVFIYLTPCLTALGLHYFVPSERLRANQWAGILLAFAGIAIAFWDGLASDRSSLVGDAFGVIAAALWAATTVVIRTTKLSVVSASKTLLYQIGISAVTLPLASAVLGEPGVVALTPVVIWQLALPGCDRDFRQLSRLVLAADALHGSAVVGVHVPDPAVRRGGRRDRAARTLARGVRGGSGPGRSGDLPGQPAKSSGIAGLNSSDFNTKSKRPALAPPSSVIAMSSSRRNKKSAALRGSPGNRPASSTPADRVAAI